MSKINDIDLKKWKEYDEILSESLWIIEDRDKGVGHKGDYHGNFIPQIPNQLFLRYTKRDDWILDPFMGSGTSLIEAKRMNRNSIGIDIDDKAVDITKKRVGLVSNDNVSIPLIGDSRTFDFGAILNENGTEKVQFVIYHPPYWDIIKFNEKKGNIANTETLENFLSEFDTIFDNTIKHLEKDKYFAIVIGDIYKKGEWIPLNSIILNNIIKKNYLLKSIVVKNMGETKGKSNQKALWRYRSLAGGFYVFSHEYILIFKNSKSQLNNHSIF